MVTASCSRTGDASTWYVHPCKMESKVNARSLRSSPLTHKTPHSLSPHAQCNHRSWADFFVDLYITQGLAAPMARTMVFFAFPIFMPAVIVLKGIIFFKRGAIADKVVRPSVPASGRANGGGCMC